jgi:hypothetical protein
MYPRALFAAVFVWIFITVSLHDWS